MEATQAALATLDEDDKNAINCIAIACDALQKQEQIEPQFQPFAETLTSSLALLQDTVRALRAYARKTDLDPDRQQVLDDRISLWLSLARRYKCAPQDLHALLQSCKQQLQSLDAAADVETLEQALATAWQAYLQEADTLTRARHKAAPELAQTITLAMQGLGMQGGQFEVQVQTAAQALQTGFEEITFLVAGHAGSTPRPVNRIASGGELSRLALAIAVTTSQLGTAQTLVFDEIDAGIGGAVAQTVGRLMRQLGADRQVLAVTHLPQVAACANHHLVVSKQLQGNSTVSSVTAVVDQQREAELARMLGGEHILASTLAHARDMLHTHGI
ncbi:DNA repair protein RecN [mine drainage metagenome]|uniref:DNA repair protein RecN n=1 Tax=mine drainage metagenome TaxID=410659 RepID=A0A1J5PH50_9ZZZZ